MTEETKKTTLAKSNTDWLNRFYELFGEPPLLDTDDFEAYDALVSRLIEEKNPKSVIELMDIRTAVDKFTEAQRFAHLKPCIIEYSRKVHQHQLEKEIIAAAKLKSSEARWGAKTQLESDLRNLQGAPEIKAAETERITRESNEKRKAELTKIEKEFDQKLKALAAAPASDIHAATFDDWIGRYEQADQLERGAWTQSIAALDQLERHQAGLGLHNRAEEIEDVEYHEFGRDRLAAPEAPTIGKDAPDAAEPPAAAPKPSTVCGNELITDEVRGDLAVAIDASAICATSVGSSWEDVMPPIDSSNGIAPDASEPHEGPVPAD